jgi:hypothetical protein
LLTYQPTGGHINFGNFAATLSVIARIDFYGHDGSGRTVTATGFLNITFADFTNQT